VFLLAPPAVPVPSGGNSSGAGAKAAVTPRNSHVDAYLNVAFTLLGKHQYQPAIGYTDLVLKEDSHCGRAYLYKGYALCMLEKPREAAQNIKHGLDLLPNYGKGVVIAPNQYEESSYHFLASALQDCGKDQEAADSLDKALTCYTDRAMLYDDQGTLFLRLHKYDRAIQDFSKQIKYSSKCYNGYENRARVYFAMQEPQKALSDLNKAISFGPSESALYTARAKVYKKLGRPDLAKIDIDKSNQVGSANFYAP